MKKRIRTWLLIVAAVLVVASALTMPRGAEPADGALLAGARVPAGVLATLQRSCADCHSDRTRYPWYSYVAPVSILVKSDVTEGREKLNFSAWSQITPVLRQRRLSEIANQVRDGEMPLGIYTFLHRDAVLSDADKAAIFEWTQAERLRLIEEGAAAAGRN